MEPRWLIAEVSLLPWPHNPFKCANAGAFRAAREPAEVVEGLTPEQLGACWTHTVDWLRVAERAVQVVQAGHDHPPDEVYRELGSPLDLHLLYLFVEPIFVTGNQLGNGQHRVCAMKAQGVPLVPIENPVYEPPWV